MTIGTLLESTVMSEAIDMRAGERAAFLGAAGWGAARAEAIAGDASTRSYERLRLGERTAVLMNAPPAAESAPCPPDATDAERRELGYNAMARLAGPNLNAFLAIARALGDAGLSAPEVYAADPETGFALIEDLGDWLYARAIPDGADETALYANAVDALLALREADPEPPCGARYRMLSYDRLAMEAEVALVTEWWWACKTGARPSPDLAAEHAAAWDAVLAELSAPHALILRDYHAENLLWLPDRAGHRRVGVIDFQDGLFGHAAYDLVSLLEDARRDVAPGLAEDMIARYCERSGSAPGFDAQAFRRDYAILGAQRNAKILGVFARLIRRYGKPRYAQFLPRVEAHFRSDLARPALAPVRAFYARRLPEIAP